MQQPQPQAIPNPFENILEGAQIRATANGVPVNLPPEVLNQLLNQHFQQHGNIPNFAAAIQQHQQNLHQQQRPPRNTDVHRLVEMEQERDSLPAHREEEREELDTAIANLREQINNAQEPRGQQQPNEPADSQGENTDGAGGQQVDRQVNNDSVNPGTEEQQHTQNTMPGSAPLEPTQPSDEVLNTPPATDGSLPAAPPQSHTVTRSGINPDGSRWTLTTVPGDHNHHHHHNHQHTHHQHQHPQGVPHGLPPQFVQLQPGIPMFAQGQFPPQMPFPIPSMQQPAGLPRMGTPPVGLRPAGTPRSVSPARSISEGQRRVGTPAAELQNRLENTRREIANVNRLLGTMSAGTMASGEPTSPLSEERRQHLRTFAASMMRNIDGFGADLDSLANALHPSVRVQPEFASLLSLYQAVHAQGRAIQQRVQDMTLDNVASASSSSQRLQPPTTSTPQVATSPQRTSTTLPLTRTTEGPMATPPRTPELHLLTDPSGTPQALIVGPTGNFTTGVLPPEILYGLLFLFFQLLRFFFLLSLGFLCISSLLLFPSGSFLSLYQVLANSRPETSNEQRNRPLNLSYAVPHPRSVLCLLLFNESSSCIFWIRRVAALCTRRSFTVALCWCLYLWTVNQGFEMPSQSRPDTLDVLVEHAHV